MASHLGKTVAELSGSITFTELLDWMRYLSWEERRVKKWEHYLAQIAAEVRRSYVKAPKRVKSDQFMMTYVSQQDRDRIEQSKSVWLTSLRLTA